MVDSGRVFPLMFDVRISDAPSRISVGIDIVEWKPWKAFHPYYFVPVKVVAATSIDSLLETDDSTYSILKE